MSASHTTNDRPDASEALSQAHTAARTGLLYLVKSLPLLLGALLLVLSVTFIGSLLSEVTLADVIQDFWSVSVAQIASALLLTAGSYAILVTYDRFALRSAGLHVPFAASTMIGFVATAFSQTLGFGTLTGSAVRFRLYGACGLPAADIARVIVVTGLAFWFGLAAVASVSLLTGPGLLAQLTAIPAELIQCAGALIALGLAAYFACRWVWPQSVVLGGWSLPLPGVAGSALQLLLGAADMLLSAGVLWVLLPAGANIGFADFAGAYALVIVAGYVSHIPGGLGVLEAGMLLVLPQVPPHQLLAVLLLYRCIYYLLPFAIAASLLAWHELRRHAAAASWAADIARPFFHSVAPPVIAAAVFLGGVVLLFSGATPALGTRMDVLRDIVPLPFIELSHLIASMAGVFLIVLSNGLYRRLDAAWTLTVATLALAILVSLAKGLDWEEASILALVLALTSANHAAFYRRSSLFNEKLSPFSVLALCLACAASIWVGFMAYRQVDYSNELWWQVEYAGDAPRFLRASLLVVIMAGAAGLHVLLRPARGRAAYGIPDDVVRIVGASESPEANLALTGDKRFLVSEQRDAFIMYDVQGKSWIAMGDPVGNRERFVDLLWQFHDMADRQGGRTVLYEVRAEQLPNYLDLGLSLLKIGEEAWIDLKAFSLEGGARSNLRQSNRKAEKQGLTFEVIPADRVRFVLPELKAVSEDWLQHKGKAEKGFSIGKFDAAYLMRFDHAVVRYGGRIVAFANIWQTGERRQFSIDLMRHSSDAPKGHMDYLFAQLLLWGKAQGFEWFNLGMAPLSGLGTHRLASAWHKAGNLIFEYGEQLYGFEGLRAFKEKFRPEWRPCYMACSGGIALPLVLLDVTLLISKRRRGDATPAETPRLKGLKEQTT